MWNAIDFFSTRYNDVIQTEETEKPEFMIEFNKVVN